MFKAKAYALSALIVTVGPAAAYAQSAVNTTALVDTSLSFYQVTDYNSSFTPSFGNDGREEIPDFLRRYTIHIWNGNGTRPLRIQPSALSRPFRYTGTSPLRIFSEPIRELEEGVPLPEPIATIDIDPNAKDLTVFARPSGRGSDMSLSLLSVDTSPEALLPGRALVYNFTGENIAVRAGQASEQIKNGELKQIDYGALEDNQLRVFIASQTEEGWKLIYTKTLASKEKARYLVIVSKGRANATTPHVEIIRK